ncbi:hypothetical protein M011DRAFT_225994 [Sporormia fimetaria CBS 119925]|uniref:Uncharacterized protein n=1 Tax=Sporormia fimetaria CBS 119925 TaxID=1340428 RepID=A0A6A6UY31_9PLEO|nr:hypothetical protein M011DRAFT_225994 [Sporormia fimetaria CBS 119925]
MCLGGQRHQNRSREEAIYSRASPLHPLSKPSLTSFELPHWSNLVKRYEFATLKEEGTRKRRPRNMGYSFPAVPCLEPTDDPPIHLSTKSLLLELQKFNIWNAGEHTRITETYHARTMTITPVAVQEGRGHMGLIKSLKQAEFKEVLNSRNTFFELFGIPPNKVIRRGFVKKTLERDATLSEKEKEQYGVALMAALDELYANDTARIMWRQ